MCIAIECYAPGTCLGNDPAGWIASWLGNRRLNPGDLVIKIPEEDPTQSITERDRRGPIWPSKNLPVLRWFGCGRLRLRLRQHRIERGTRHELAAQDNRADGRAVVNVGERISLEQH